MPLTAARLFAVLLLCLSLLLASPQEAGAHRRTYLPRTVTPPPVATTSQPVGQTTPRPLSRLEPGPDPAALLQQAETLEKAADLPGAQHLLLKFVNLFPRHPDCSAALMKLAQLAQKSAQQELACEVYTLIVHLYPGTGIAQEARLALLKMELAQGLAGNQPLKAFRNFLQNLPPDGLGETALREAVDQGWQEIARQVQGASPCSLSLLEEILALWDLTPPGLKSPAAKRLVADLLQEKGLLSQAGALLPSAPGGSPAPPRPPAEVNPEHIAGLPSTSPDALAFSQDRLGLSQLQNHRLEEAKEIYQLLARDGDQFWQLLARTRLTDLELARLTAESSP